MVVSSMKNQKVDRPNRASAGTLSGHAAGEPFEKRVYHMLKVEQRYALLESPTALFLLCRGDKATKEWSPTNIFEEKQNDTADILYYEKGFYDIIDVKTRNRSKLAQPPNIISAYKLAKMCALMIDNEEYDSVNIDYLEIDWIENGPYLLCIDAHHGDLFKSKPDGLYINWAAAMQVQFHVCDLDQTWKGTKEEWARNYLKAFVTSAEYRCQKMREMYVVPFLKYIK